jgi:putative hydrolase of the HAD superfamily
MLKYLLFDLDNTLYSSSFGLEDNVRRRIKEFSAAFLGVSMEEAWQQRFAMRQKYGTNLEWLMNEKGFTDVEAYLAAVHPPDEAETLVPDPALREVLESIDLPKAILTNSPAEHADRILAKLGAADLFTHIFDIRQCAFKGKPRPEVFNHALEELGVTAAETLFIDDSPQYVEGFIALGGRGLLFDENNQYPDFPRPRISALAEIKKFLNTGALS